MEKRISPVELRLGFNADWKQKFLTANKFYNDSIKLTLFIIYFLDGLQKVLGYTIPNPLVKIFISKNYFSVNYVYILNKKKQKINKIEMSEDEDVSEQSEKNLEKCLNKNISTKNLVKLKINKLLLKTANRLKKKKSILKIKLKHKIKFKIIKKKLKTLIILAIKNLNNKLFEENLCNLFFTLTKKPCYITKINLAQTLAKNPENMFKNFYEIRDWYKKIGGRLFGFNKRLITTYYALSYKNCIPLYLNMIKNDIENNLTKQRSIMTMTYNILFAYTWVQRNIEGLRITFKGTIGNHGRAKSMTFMFGGLYQASLSRQVEYYYVKIDTKFGCIGMKFWCVFN